MEIILRNLINFDMNYYSSPKKIDNKSIIIHPYGKIPINSDGFFDEEFRFDSKKPKIGYFGDSVTYGVGAGHPYRFTEYLDQLSPEFEHLNLSGGLGISLANWNEKINEFLLKKNISKIIYVINLNDIAPLSNKYIGKNNIPKNVKNINFFKKIAAPFDKYLRGESMLYTYFRFKIKSILVKRGFEASGFKSIELFPTKNVNHIINASKIINNWSSKMKNIGIQTCLVILPYEMQISRNASEYYKSIGIQFEENFEEFSTQKILIENLSSVSRPYFVKDGFEEKNIGYYYVFDKGDKIDFNHPNRKGHFVIASEISRNKICDK